MMPSIFTRFFIALALAALLGNALAEKVITQSHQGLTLNGNLELIDGQSLAEGVVLISPTMRGGEGGPRFVQYLVVGSEAAATSGAAAGVQEESEAVPALAWAQF